MISETEFRAEAKAFLDDHAEPPVEEKFEWGKGSDRVGLLEEKTPEQEPADLRAAQGWKAEEFDAGFGWITGPEEYGGRALTAGYDRAYRELAAGYAIPSQSAVRHRARDGRADDPRPRHPRGEGALPPSAVPGRHHRLPAVLGADRGLGPGRDPDGRAVRDGDEWILNGQKVWTSGAQFSDIGEIITRTSPDKPKHKGLTMFLVDMHAPGVEVRPLRQMTGGASFNEVFFTDVRVPDTHRLGDVDEGWTVALTTLMNERAAIGGGGAGGGVDRHAPGSARSPSTSASPTIRSRASGSRTSTSTTASPGTRTCGPWPRSGPGQLPGPEMSIAKLALTQNMQRIAQTLGELLGPRLVADTRRVGHVRVGGVRPRASPACRVAGGTDEVMRNIVGERVLGLPKEPPGPTGR